MITYILESIAFQLVFLLTYDLFLKKETFFQWNRVYLLGTFVLSLVLPWIKVEALQTSMPEGLGVTTAYLTQLNGVVLGPEIAEQDFLASIPWPYWILGAGSFLATVWFAYKLIQIRQLRNKGFVQRFADFTKITVPQSSTAFSFFRNVFLGEEIKRERVSNILAHELVHVKQFHSLDLIFFELVRILFWFNPLVYVYQNRIAELHEFIADAQAVKHNKTDHFEMLLSEAFNAQNISFVNQFFNQSLIKKRIVMLQKKKSKAVWQLKYVLLLPLVLGMLLYTSCENEKENNTEISSAVPLEEMVIIGYKGNIKTFTLNVGDLDALTSNEIEKQGELMIEVINDKQTCIVELVDKQGRNMKIEIENGVVLTASVNKPIKAKYVSTETKIPIAKIDEAPIFPGCEDAMDKKQCFLEQIQNHVRNHFKYPEEAQEQGIQGRVNIIFIINGHGDIVDIKTRGPHELLEKEAERIIKALPKMQPGKHKNKIVDVPFSMPITFKLQ